LEQQLDGDHRVVQNSLIQLNSDLREYSANGRLQPSKQTTPVVEHE
jgi:hypothetical protein